MKRRERYTKAFKFKPWDGCTAHEYNPHEGLWISVIMQALRDACTRSNTSEHKAAREEAKHWFRKGGLDFIEVCLNAGYDPDYIQALGLKTIASGKRFILPPGESKHYLRNKLNRDKRKNRGTT